jgi:hypothetical protein
VARSSMLWTSPGPASWRLEDLPAFFGRHGWHDASVAGEAEVVCMEAGGQDFDTEAAFVLQAAEFIHRTFEDSVGFEAGPVHACLGASGIGVCSSVPSGARSFCMPSASWWNSLARCNAL